MKIGKYTITGDTLIVALGAFIVLFTFYCLAWVPPDPFVKRGTYLVVFFVLSVVLNPPKSKPGKIIIGIFVAMGVVGTLYPMVFHSDFAAQMYWAAERDTYFLPIFLIGLAGVLTRVGGGNVVLVMMSLAVLYLLFGYNVPGLFGIGDFDKYFITSLLYTDITQGAFGQFLDIFTRLMSIFMIFAAFLLTVGLGDLFTAIASWIAGNATGGPAKVSVISSATFGMISGSPTSNVVATGSFTIPTMINVGYEPRMAATVESIASVGGMMMPPIMSTAGFFIAELLGVPYLRICAVAIIPVFFWYFTVYNMVHFYALKTRIKKWRPSMAEAMAIIKTRAHFLLAILALLGALLYFASAEQGAFFAVMFLIGLSFIRKDTRLNKAKIASFVRSFVKLFGPLVILICALAVFITILTGTGAHLKIGRVLMGGIEQWYIVLLLVFGLVVLIGMGVMPFATYLAASAIAVPILAKLGFNLFAIHFFIFYVACLAPITPPVCLASFNAAKLAGTPLMRTGFYASIMSLPLWIVPFVMIKKGLFLTIGTPLIDLITGVAIVCFGVLMFIVGTQGYFRRHLKTFERVLAIITGIMIVQPISDYFSNVFLVVGAILIVYWLVSRFLTDRKGEQSKNLVSSPAE
ncbi:TRAP transporter permease [Chloroflexota bacterium]